MSKSHLKRHATPKSWPILRKVNKYVTRAKPGAHPLELGLPLSVVLKDMLGEATTTKEVKKILQNNEVLLDGKRVIDHRRQVGFMDVISFVNTKKYYRISLNQKGKIIAIEVNDKESNLKLSKITGKSLVKGKTQLNMIDGRNILTDKDDYKVGDVLLLELPTQKIVDKVSLDKKTKVFLLGGKHIGQVESVEDYSGKKITLKSDDGNVFETLRKYAFVVGKDKEIIQIIAK